MNETEYEANEYLDAFVALGGSPDKDGFVSKETLIQIIKLEFELTIDMVVSRIIFSNQILGILAQN
jgi:hypothetical protein